MTVANDGISSWKGSHFMLAGQTTLDEEGQLLLHRLSRHGVFPWGRLTVTDLQSTQNAIDVLEWLYLALLSLNLDKENFTIPKHSTRLLCRWQVRQ